MTNQQEKGRALGRVVELAEKVAEPLGLSVLEVRFSQQGRLRSVEVCIMRRQGQSIGLGDCEQVSRQVDLLLEEEAQKLGHPLVDGAFVLEVVSPGIERQLTSAREFQMFAGSQIRVRARENIGVLGSEFVGVLLGGDESHIDVKDCKPLEISGGKVAKSKGSNGGKASEKSNSVEQTQDSQAAELRLELTRLFKINLYSQDLHKPGKSVVH